MEDRRMEGFPDEAITKEPSAPLAEHQVMLEIRTMLEAPDYDPYRVARKILLAISIVIEEFMNLRNDPMVVWKLPIMVAIIRALRELQRSVMDTERLRRNESLDFEGPKFLHVLGQITEWLAKAMRNAGLSEEICNRVFREYRDIATVEEPDLRREVA